MLNYQLTKADESLLFEFEVRFRGACDESTLLTCMHTLRTELLEDCPAELFLTRPTVSSATTSSISYDVTPQVQRYVQCRSCVLVSAVLSSVCTRAQFDQI
jgi:hypothetical protein